MFTDADRKKVSVSAGTLPAKSSLNTWEVIHLLLRRFFFVIREYTVVWMENFMLSPYRGAIRYGCLKPLSAKQSQLLPLFATVGSTLGVKMVTCMSWGLEVRPHCHQKTFRFGRFGVD
jgi:hypothetical protein